MARNVRTVDSKRRGKKKTLMNEAMRSIIDRLAPAGKLKDMATTKKPRFKPAR